VHLVLVDYRRGSCERGRMVDDPAVDRSDFFGKFGVFRGNPFCAVEVYYRPFEGEFTVDWRKGSLRGRGGKIRGRLRLDRRRDRRSLDLLSGENRR